MTYTCHMLTCHIYLFSDNGISLSHVNMSYTLFLLTMTYPCHMLTCHIYLFSDNGISLSHVDMSYILIYLLSAKMTYTSEFLKFIGPSHRAGRKSQVPAILPRMPVWVSDTIFCLCILFCTGNRKCNWYA